MKINLKKANALQLTIGETLGGINTNPVISLQIYTDVNDKFEEELARVYKNTSRVLKLNAVLHAIRKAVSAANYKAGISDLLADVAELTKNISVYATFAAAPKHEEMRVINSKLKRLESAEISAYGYSENVTTSVFSATDLADVTDELKTLKRERDAKKEEILLLNLKTTITLSEEQVEVLKSEGLI